jgi:hypothetical protein
MDNAFFALSSAVRAEKLGYISPPPLGFTGLLQALEKELRKATVAEITLFVDANYEEVSRVRYHLSGVVRSTPSLRGNFDRIFTNYMRVDRRMPSGITRILDAFIRGISYFSYQAMEASPIYHRLMSCGTGTDAFRAAFQQCTPDMATNRREDIKQRIHTCYLERLIYNEMFKHQTLLFPLNGTEEDNDHLNWLDQTHRDYLSCFPKSDIVVELTFDQMWPIRLTIQRKVRGAIVSTESYTRTLTIALDGGKAYEDAVDCTRETAAHAYYKTQRFTHETRWIKTTRGDAE